MERKGIEIAVGLFVLAGIAVAALLVLKLGRAGSSLKTEYEIVVQFPSASGLIKNAKVRMAGVEVGKVLNEPGFNENRSRARVRLGIQAGVVIREGSKFSIKQTAMLADPCIEIDAVTDPKVPPIMPGTIVEGSRSPGLDDLTEKVEPMLGKIQDVATRLDSAIGKIDYGILTPETQADVRSAISNLNVAVKHIDGAVKRVNEHFLTDDARDNVHGAVSNLNSAVARVDRILAQAERGGAVSNLNSAIARVDRILADAERGRGAFHSLMKDPEIADDIRVFVHSLREKGVLFYREVDPDKKDDREKSGPVLRRPGEPRRR